MSDLRPQADLSPVYCSERKGKLAWSGVETEIWSQYFVRMSLDLYTRNIPLTQKAKFWGNYVSALKGQYWDWVQSGPSNQTIQALPTCALAPSLASPTSTPPSPRPSHRPTATSGTSSGSWRIWCGDRTRPSLFQLQLFLLRMTGKPVDCEDSVRSVMSDVVLTVNSTRIHTIGYNYCPVHTEIYGSYRSQAVRGCL